MIDIDLYSVTRIAKGVGGKRGWVEEGQFFCVFFFSGFFFFFYLVSWCLTGLKAPTN